MKNKDNIKDNKENKKLDDKNEAFKSYFGIITKIVYTLNSISERNDMTRRLSSNIDRALGYEDESETPNEKLTSGEEIELLKESIKKDLKKVEGFKKYNFNIEEFISRQSLNDDERYILYCIVIYSLYGDSMSAMPLRRLLELITFDSDIYITKHNYFEDKSKLMSSGIFVLSHEPYSSGGILEISHTLISFVNSKVLFAFLEKEPYEVLENMVDKETSYEVNIIKRKNEKSENILTPKEIVKELDKAVIGQQKAKKVLSVHAYLHCLRMSGKTNIPFRSNIMMIGPTGVGKTYLVKTLADILGIPFARADVTTLTETGYVGDDVEVVLYNLYRKAKGDIEKAQNGIVFLDEVDKIAKADAHQSTTGNPSDKAVQEALLSIMNGEDVRVPECGDRRMMHSSDGIVMNTKNILFIFGGAFVGLEDIIKSRLKGETSLGFGSSAKTNKYQKNKILNQVDVKDIEKYGMIPEFIGRIPIVVTLNELTKEDLREILLHASESPIIKYIEFFKSLGKKLTLSNEAINFIVDKSSDMNMGARSLKSIVETAMVSVLFNLDGIKGNSLTLTKSDIEQAFEEKEPKKEDEIGKKSENKNINPLKEEKTYMA